MDNKSNEILIFGLSFSHSFETFETARECFSYYGQLPATRSIDSWSPSPVLSSLTYSISPPFQHVRSDSYPTRARQEQS